MPSLPASVELLSEADFTALAGQAEAADRNMTWPEQSWQVVQRAGVLEWAIPSQYGGRELNSTDQLTGYERLAAACLTTAFILSQRDAAVRRIRDTGRDDLCRELLRPLACGGRFATVGLSQLTTSRQHGGPALRVEETADGFVLDGVMPWVTGADHADHLITGGVLADGRQILLALPASTQGVAVQPPMDLSALAGSRTAEVTCSRVTVDRHWLLAGPVENVFKGGSRGGTGGLETSCLALGLAGAAIDRLHEEAAVRPALADMTGKLELDRTRVREEMHRLARSGLSSPTAPLELRAKANALVLRATQAALTACKGAGFVHPHAAQRWARQALFFLVWSCPRPAAEATMEYLFGGCER
ncbi:MAG TPA: acyl-CoA dehydrogenase family protein [Gemmataceae bacterium]|jgi:alkylation response protein AidB-like acyl-CoA dehydrogenase|nr:acyl-CoA dehydrogenase family protein [Gemmataceae bacterium]